MDITRWRHAPRGSLLLGMLFLTFLVPVELFVRIQYFFALENIQIPSFLCGCCSMHKQHRRQLQRLVSADEEVGCCEGEGRLDSIIKTFRENNLRLMQKIEECERMREMEHHLNQKKLSERHLFVQLDSNAYHLPMSSRPLSQFKTDRRHERTFKDLSRKENLALEMPKRTPLPKTEDCEQAGWGGQEEKNHKIIKISLNRLVPLSMEKLKERMKAL